MDKKITELIKNLEKRNISAFYFDSKEKAQQKILEMIPKSCSVGFSGSMTLEGLGMIKLLEARGNRVFNPYQAGISRGESLELRRQGTQADYYLASPNAVSQSGELVFFSAFGNRTAGVAYGKNVILVCGINKISANIKDALKRAREYAAPLNCKRLNWASACLKDGVCHEDICFSPEYKRMCCQVLTIEGEPACGRLSLVLAGDNLGF